jgi:uncharacterized Tic20 family protein
MSGSRQENSGDDLQVETSADQYYRPPQDERTMACISHLAIFVSSIGLIVAIGLWIYLRNKQPYAAFQAAQAVLYQLVVLILTFMLIIGFLVLFFGAFGIGLASGADPEQVSFAAFLVILTLLFFAAVSILALAMYIYAIYAAVRSYQGRPFRIPGIAMIADAINPMPPVHPEGSSGR